MDISEATIHDINQLAVHHRKMFEEMWELTGQKIEPATLLEIEKEYAEKLTEQIPSGDCKAWVVKKGDQLVASGAISIVSFVPVPHDTNPTIAYLHSMYTEKKFRGRNYAKAIVNKATQYSQEHGINRIILNASDAGKPLYEQSGFVSSPETMRLFIK